MQDVTGNSSTVDCGRYEWAKLLRLSLEKSYEIRMAWELLGDPDKTSKLLPENAFGYSKVETLQNQEGAQEETFLLSAHGRHAPNFFIFGTKLCVLTVQRVDPFSVLTKVEQGRAQSVPSRRGKNVL